MPNITKKEILDKFSQGNLADLLLGAKAQSKIDKDLIQYLFEEMQEAKQGQKELIDQIKKLKKELREKEKK